MRRKFLYVVHGWSYTCGLISPLRYLTFIPEFILEVVTADISAHSFVSLYDKLNRPIPLLNRLKRFSSRVIYNTSSLADIKCCQPSFAAFPPDSIIRILTIARLDRQKNIDLLLESLVFLPNYSLDIVGDGPEFPRLYSKVFELGLSHRVKFHGYLESMHIAELLSSSHVFALISHWEGFPLSTVEALSFGLPVVVSNVGGAAEVFNFTPERPCGLPVSPSISAIQLSKVFKQITHSGLFNQYSSNSKFIYETYLAPPVFFASYDCFFRDLFLR